MININNSILLDALFYSVDKEENEFTLEELSSIESLTLNSKIMGIYFFEFNFEELKYLTSLREITFNNIDINETTIDILNNLSFLENVKFNSCSFAKEPKLSNIEELSITKGNLMDFSFISSLSNLKSLSLVNVKLDKLNFLNRLDELEMLELSGSTLPLTIHLDKTNIKELYLDETNISEFNSVFFPLNLERLFISSKQYNLNPKYFDALSEEGISILSPSNMSFGGDSND